MRGVSHRTLIASMREIVGAWRKRKGWSRETVVSEIVEAHERIAADKTTGIRFEPGTQDAIARLKVNADRVFRWLDDEGKDNNLLPLNFLPSVLAALPADLCDAWLDDELLRPLGRVSHRIEVHVDQPLDLHADLVNMLKEDGEAQQAMAKLMAGVTVEALAKAHKEVRESIEVNMHIMEALESAMAAQDNVIPLSKAAA